MNQLARRLATVALTMALMLSVAPCAALAATPSQPKIYSATALLTTMDGTVLWQNKGNTRRRTASTIKMLTALVVMDNADLDDVIRVDHKATTVQTGVGLRTGQKLTVRQLLSVMLVKSANDCAEALAIGVGGSEKKFAAMMNAKAKSLGLKHTHAVDPHGLSPKGYSTAADLAVIARNLMTDPVLRDIVGSRRATLSGGQTFGTTDGLLGSYPGLEGGKTGYTDPAGYCFVAAAKRDDVELVGVVLGADSSSARFVQMRRLLDWGFAHAHTENVVSRETTMGMVEVEGGVDPTITVHARRDLTVTTLGSNDGIRSMLSLPAHVRAPVTAGQTIGAVRVLRGGAVVATVPLCADKAVVACPAPAASPGGAPTKTADRSIWDRIVTVMAGFGRLLGV